MMWFFTKRLSQDEKLLKNIEEYEQKEKAKQQKPEIHGQKPGNYKRNTEESVDERG